MGELLLSVISGLTLLSVPRDGADVEEVLTVITEAVLGRLVEVLEVICQRLSVWTQQLTEVTPAPLPIQRTCTCQVGLHGK